MRLKQLHYFLTTARLEHMSNAAIELGISQSSLSKTIARLEEHIGVPLFERKGKAIFLNEYGKLFYQRVNQILLDLHDAEDAVHELANLKEDRISINVMNSKLLPRLFFEFYKNRPNVKLHQYLLPDHIAQQKLKTGEIDLMIVPNPVNDEALEWVPLFKEEVFLVVPNSHRLASRTSVKLSEVREEMFILSSEGQSFRETENRIFHDAGFEPNIGFEGEDLSVILQLVNEGTGVAFIFKNSFLDTYLDQVAIIPISEPTCEQVVGIAWNKFRENSYVVESFKKFAINFLKQ